MTTRNFKLPPVNRVSVVESVTERVLTLINSGRINAGERLPSEQELAEQLGVGRSSIREALRSLFVLGLVEARAGRGTIVTSTNAWRGGDRPKAVVHWGVRDIFEVRILLETRGAERAAMKASEAEIESIAKAAQALERRARTGKGYFSENLVFHMRVAEASHNPVLSYSLSGIIGRLRDVREKATEVQPVEADLEEHRQIIEAIRLRDPSTARDVMRRHLERNIAAFGEPRDDSRKL